MQPFLLLSSMKDLLETLVVAIKHRDLLLEMAQGGEMMKLKINMFEVCDF